MITTLKSVARKSNFLVDLYYDARFVKAAISDLPQIQKIALLFKVKPYTMVSYERLSNAYELSKEMEEKQVEGAFVECGVWKGGAIGVMAHAAKERGSERQIWLLDSFEGLPEPTVEDGKDAARYASQKTSGNLRSIGKCVGPLEDVRRLFSSVLRIPEAQVRLGRGWFQETIPQIKKEIGKIAILRIDADWYESTKYVLDQLYDQIVPGGYVIIDDYGAWDGCKRAVEEFLRKRDITPQLKSIDDTGVYFQKEQSIL
ncbi:MAG: TylF/MycF/NovP-related O-methyltransferase [Candidatus Yanofskybacteria bacterium]|nr:TylF/MycF/NovP-related O-methyltransferase [Candidatus Yanofskybacteria bacterium]